MSQELQNKQQELEIEKQNLSQNFDNRVMEKFQNFQQQQIAENQNLTINDITEKYENKDQVDGYHFLEVNRILQNEPSLSFSQARSLANSNGCLESGSNTMCPSKRLNIILKKVIV